MEKVMEYVLSGKFIISSIVFVICILVCVLLGRTKKKITKNTDNLKDPKFIFTRRIILIARIVVILLGFIIICQINGINLMSLVTGLGIAGAVAGLAFQDYLKDIIMGFHILSDRFFTIGDCVNINGNEGIVVGFTLTTTKLQSVADRSTFTICNRNINEVKKLSGLMFIDVPISYDCDAEKIHNIFEAFCKETAKKSDIKKCEFFGTQEFDSSAILYRIAVYCSEAKKYAVRRAVLFDLQKTLKDENIVIPFNQLDVHIDGANIKE